MIIDFSKEEEDKLLFDLYQNYPEASFGSALRCTGFDYAEFKFEFLDEETGKKYVVDEEMARKGLYLFIKLVLGGESGFSVYGNRGDWDAEVIDAITQLAIFGEVIYG